LLLWRVVMNWII